MALWYSRVMPLFDVQIAEIRQETPSVKSFVLDFGDQGFSFLPGQWVDLYAVIEDREMIGGYSVTSTPSRKGSFELAIRYAPGHLVTRFMHEQARVGTRLRVSEGQGTMTFDPGKAGSPLALIAGGVGITPLISIAQAALESDPARPVSLIYSVKDASEMIFRERLERFAREYASFRLVTRLTRERGRIDAAFIRNLFAKRIVGASSVFYLCGPPGLVDAVAADLKSLDVPGSLVHFEKWW